MFCKTVLCPKNKQKLFHVLVVVYCLGLTGLLISWRVHGTSRSLDAILYHDNTIRVDSLKKKYFPSVKESVADKTLLNPVYIGGNNCSKRRVVSFFDRPMLLSAEPICSWLKSEHSLGNFIGYANEFAHLHDVVVNPLNAAGRKGGENMSSVWKQNEQDEYLKLKSGYFSIQCNTSLEYQFSSKTHLKEWKNSLACDPKNNFNGMVKIKGLTIAVQRYEYVNLYHTMTDYYNAFLVMLIFNKSPDDTTILWVDSHPSGGLDQTWKTLFSNTIRAGHLRGPTVFEDMVWSIMGYDSPLNQHNRPFTPYLEQFREFFLTRHGVSPAKTLDCAHLNVMFIWRRDYIAHPRNPSGLVKRKIANEAELLETVRKAVPGHNVTGVQLDALPMRQQLELVANTDIFLGMHGAGLAHTLFLPKHGGLIEFYPTYWSPSNRHFRAMATWRGLQYQTWQNTDSFNEKKDYYTYIPPQTLLNMFLEVKTKMCRQVEKR
ncbi:beta-1,2-xylosyltransferase-like [Gigantopelta aegis]|uniref:beta-1,2-xylosyltransferase-like n=1 Tax=Gigantopelta aegis TaxID=1735272 RepID=UPI001B8882FA|nr:beta-1,2-xylosyltransferase-like [Gigantopelta aegis]XP_041347605.1 beta-1,2-xylosyltransferase-like [Gigantopelta aegis]XP_041347606.1 beta-1,2-xylosyltransferase-like [Gigantopelta aegis]XP_041347607.1 beta-1,2-xylosyltransferase-like [Gigantopelta aegis]XP_041347608.1 beta-1,2-xylosyltransferase-like [Gigantopelta aegis]